MKYLLVLVGILILGCKGKKVEAVQDYTSNSITKVKKIDLCVLCDSIYSSFPKDSAYFEKLYGYPNGLRQMEAYEDVENYFKCLDDCYDYEQLFNIIQLGSKIKYDADGPSYVQHNLTNFLKQSPKRANKVYSNMDCKSFNQHILFLYEGIENTNFRNRLCKYFSACSLKEECKRKLVKEYCEKDFTLHSH